MAVRELFRHWTYQVFAPGSLLRERYNAFKSLLGHDDACMSLMADLEDIHYGRDPADWARVMDLYAQLRAAMERLVADMAQLSPTRYLDLSEYLKKIDFYIRLGLSLPEPDLGPPYVVGLADPAARPELIGGKAANLARVARETDLPVPEAFVVTANAFHYFLEAGELRDALDERLARLHLSRPDELGELAEEMQRLVLAADVPRDIAEPLTAAAAKLGRGGRVLAVRSSAVAEDGEASFAGQYESMLGVTPGEILVAYKKVLAAKYAAKALTYRILRGLSDQETPMAALVMPMVPARAAGVATSLEDSPGLGPHVAVYAIPGLGRSLVEGHVSVSACRASRERPSWLLTPCTGQPVIDALAVTTLSEAALDLEALFGRPQEVEWAQDELSREIVVLQSRQLQAEPERPESGPPPEVPPGRLLVAKAESASYGVAAGPVYLAETVLDVAAVPEGSVLAIATLTPALTRIVSRVAAVVARSGSRASHFAAVAREFGLPVVVNVPDVFEALTQDEVVTVDADHGLVIAGREEGLLAAAAERPRPSGPAAARLAGAMGYIVRLTLTDPSSPEFVPEKVRSLHDIVRFVHEKSVTEMFSLVGKGGRGLAGAKKLESRLPMTMYVLDLGGGLFDAAQAKDAVTPDDLKSVPMWAFWCGLSNPDVAWSEALHHVDWEEFDRVSAGIVSKDSKLLASYAVISGDYMHLMLRFGYHFSVIDSLCGSDDKMNYISFRFKGGGGSFEQRLLRLTLIKDILTRFGFTMESRGDLLDARFQRDTEQVVQKRLAMLGYLMAATRLMDMGLTEESVAGITADILAKMAGAGYDQV